MPQRVVTVDIARVVGADGLSRIYHEGDVVDVQPDHVEAFDAANTPASPPRLPRPWRQPHRGERPGSPCGTRTGSSTRSRPRTRLSRRALAVGAHREDLVGLTIEEHRKQWH